MRSLGKLFQSRKYLLIIIGVILVGGFILWRTLGNNQSKTTYQTAKVERGTIVSSVTVSGQILNTNTINITTQASGTIKQIFVKDGQIVNKGDDLLEINLDEAGQQRSAQTWSSYLSAKNTLEAANATAYSLQSDMFTKWKTFFDLATNSTYQNSDGSPNEINRSLAQFHIAQKDWLAAEAKYKNQQAVITQARAALNSAWLSYQLSSPIITAPMNGTLANLVVVKGMNINNTIDNSTSTTSSQQIAVIKNEAKPLATFNLSEVDVTKVKPSQKTTLTLDSIPGKTFTGKVMTVDKLGSISSGVTNYPVIIQFDTDIPQILPNMAASANIIIDSKDNALLVPSASIQNTGDQNYARVLKNGKEQQIPVEIGLTSDSQSEITSGLKEGDEVVTGTLSNTSSTTGSSLFGGGARGGNIMRLGR